MTGKYPIAFTDRRLVNPADLNSDWNMHGGWLFYYMDRAASIVARDHSGHVCNTVAGSSFKYFKPLNTSHEAIIAAKITRAWDTSMEIKVDAYRKGLGETPEKVMGIYLYFVALKHGEPQKVPNVIPQTVEEVREYMSANARRREVKQFIEKYIQDIEHPNKTISEGG